MVNLSTIWPSDLCRSLCHVRDFLLLLDIKAPIAKARQRRFEQPRFEHHLRGLTVTVELVIHLRRKGPSQSDDRDIANDENLLSVGMS
jgi:hypothetical protein